MPRTRHQLRPSPLAIAIVATVPLSGCVNSDGTWALVTNPIESRYERADAEPLAGRWVWRSDPGTEDAAMNAKPFLFNLVTDKDGTLRLTFADTDPPAPPLRVTLLDGASRSYAVLRREYSFFEGLTQLPMPPDTPVCVVYPVLIEGGRITPMTPQVWLVFADNSYVSAGTFELDPHRIESAEQGDVLCVFRADDAIDYYESRDDTWFLSPGSFVRSE